MPGRLSVRAGAEPTGVRRQWRLRLAGCLFGLGCWGVGLYTWLGASVQDMAGTGRAEGFALTAGVVGLVAILGSLLSRDVKALWYCSPRRWRPFKDDLGGSS